MRNILSLCKILWIIFFRLVYFWNKYLATLDMVIWSCCSPCYRSKILRSSQDTECNRKNILLRIVRRLDIQQNKIFERNIMSNTNKISQLKLFNFHCKTWKYYSEYIDNWWRIFLWDVFYLAVFGVRIRFILVSRIRFNETDPDPGSKKSAKIMENFHKKQPKSLEYHTFFSKLFILCLLT